MFEANNPFVALDTLVFFLSLYLFCVSRSTSFKIVSLCSEYNHFLSLKRIMIPKICSSGEKMKFERWRTRPPCHDRERVRLPPIFVWWYSLSRFSKDPALFLHIPSSSGPIQRQREWTTQGLDSSRANLSPSHVPLLRVEEGTVPLKKKRITEQFEALGIRHSTYESNGESENF